MGHLASMREALGALPRSLGKGVATEEQKYCPLKGVAAKSPIRHSPCGSRNSFRTWDILGDGLQAHRASRCAREWRATGADSSGTAVLRLRAVPESTLMLGSSQSATGRRCGLFLFSSKARGFACSPGGTAQRRSFRRGAGSNACFLGVSRKLTRKCGTADLTFVHVAAKK